MLLSFLFLVSFFYSFFFLKLVSNSYGSSASSSGISTSLSLYILNLSASAPSKKSVSASWSIVQILVCISLLYFGWSKIPSGNVLTKSPNLYGLLGVIFLGSTMKWTG